MKWFKHFSNAHSSESLEDLLNELGFEGYGRYWRFLEFLSELFDGESVNFKIHKRTLRDCMRFKSAVKLRCFLVTIGLQHGYKVIETKDHYEIEAPILLDLKDRDFKKARKDREQHAPKKEIKNKIKNKSIIQDEEKDLDTVQPKKSGRSDLEKSNAKKVKQAYFDSYQEKYSRDPVSWAARENKLVYDFIKQVGIDNAIAIAAAFPHYPDSFLSKQAHAFRLITTSADGVAAWMHDSQHVIKSEQVRQMTNTLAKESNGGYEQRIQEQKDLEFARSHQDPFTQEQALIGSAYE